MDESKNLKSITSMFKGNKINDMFLKLLSLNKMGKKLELDTEKKQNIRRLVVPIINCIL